MGTIKDVPAFTCKIISRYSYKKVPETNQNIDKKQLDILI